MQGEMPRRFLGITAALAAVGSALSLVVACSSDPAPGPGPGTGESGADRDAQGNPYAPESDDGGGLNRPFPGSDATSERCGKPCMPL
jgi:hypothetical protein